MSENTNNEKKPLLSREIQQESTGSYEDSLNSYDYETYIKPYTPVETDTYWYRWYILALFSIVAAMGNIGWNTWGPIETTAKAVFGWNTATISLLSDWGTIAFIICLFPSSYILDTYGLRKAVLILCVCLVIGTGLRCITPNPGPATWLIHSGQIVMGCVSPIYFSAGTLLSSTWFPPHQRITATAIASLASCTGTALSFVIGPHLVDDIDNSHLTPDDPGYKKEVHRLSQQVMKMLYIHFGVAVGLLLLTLFTFPAKPPKPPSATATMERVDFKSGLCKLLKNPQFQLIAFAYGLTTGVYSAWFSDLALNLKQFDIGDETSSWLGFWAIMAGSVSGITLSLLADRLGALKLLLIMLFIVATAGFSVFSLICMRIIPQSASLFYLTSVIGGLCLNGSIPLFFELAVESSYPVAEGINTGAMTLSNNIYCLIFLSLPLIPKVGTSWMNWFLVGSCVLCVPTMIIFKERYRRLEIDLVEGSTQPPISENSLNYPAIS